MQNHYNYSFDNITNTYNFITKNNILYRVAFIVDEIFCLASNEEINNVYQIVVEKANDDLEPFDKCVSNTIEKIIITFFNNIKNSIVYVCSDDNQKAILRYKVFERWYKNSKYNELIVKIDKIIQLKISETENQKIFTSFMFHKNNPESNKLLDIYNQIEKVLNELK